MSGIFEKIVDSSRAWVQYSRLDHAEFETARIAMQALRGLNEASLPVLRHGTRKNDEHRKQLRCAVVLHWLGQPDGLPVLVDVLRHNAHSLKGVSDEIVCCFAEIGAPDATQALIGVWQSLPGLSDQDPTAILICQIWRMLQDASIIPAICETCIQTPGLFVETISYFGTEAIPELKSLAHDEVAGRRVMAAKALAQIPGYLSAQAIVPLLRDPSSEVRSAAPRALESVTGPVFTLNALSEAHREGYTSAASVQLLDLYSPPDLFEQIAALLERYEGETSTSGDVTCGDSAAAASAAAHTLIRCPWPNTRVTPLLCDLLNRGVEPSVRAAVAMALAERGPAADESDLRARKAMWAQLTEVDQGARECASAALGRFGEPAGAALQIVLDTDRPQGNLFRKIQATILNSQDVGEAVTQAVQHVATWVIRLSRVTAERFAAPGTSRLNDYGVLSDERMPELLTRLLTNSLDALAEPGPDEITVEALSIGSAALKSLGRLGPERAACANEQIRRAYVTVKLVKEGSTTARGSGDEVAVVVRESAGRALIDLYGPACFDVLAAGLEHPSDHVKLTGATALAALRDARAIPALQVLADTGAPLAALAARNAIAAIKRSNPEMMTLLRGSSSADARPDTLLRPSLGTNDGVSPELLLRPGQQGSPEA